MKKLLLSLVIILLLAVAFSSCMADDPSVTQPPEGSTPIGVGDACLERYAFKSIEDFELYCKTGSKDVSLYKIPPSKFPGYKMKEGIFVELNELFPDLDTQSITVDYIEIVTPYNFSYSGYTNDGTEFIVGIRYDENASEVSADKVIEQRASSYNNIVKGDYYTSKAEPGVSWDKRAVYIFDLDGCAVEYLVSTGGELIGMAVHHGNYVVGISVCTESNCEAFFADEVLKPITDLFSDGEARIEALNKIKQYTESKK